MHCLAGHLVTHRGRVPDPLFAELKATFFRRRDIGTDIHCLFYDMHAAMGRALQTEFDDRSDPIVEVAAPDGFSANDFMDTGR